MDSDHSNVSQVVEDDRLSSLPDELIHKIMSCFDMKFAVQTCLLSSRWKLLWTSMPCLYFSSSNFGSLLKFAKFVKRVLSHRNHQIQVSSVKLDFSGSVIQGFVRTILNYAFSHNVQELTVVWSPKKTKHHYQFLPCLFSSQSLKHFTSIKDPFGISPFNRTKTPWDFPALTTLHLNGITSVVVFSKCVNLKNLTIEEFEFKNVNVLDIITPRLSSLLLVNGTCSVFAINLIAPQLEKLTIINCLIKDWVAPPGLSSLYYRGRYPMQLSKDRYHSLNKVTICLDLIWLPYEEGDARWIIDMLQEVHCARYLTLNVDIVECLSLFPDLLMHHPSPFSNLICLTIDTSMREDAYKVKMSTEVKNFFLENSPSATFIMELPEEMKHKEHIETYE